MKPVETRGPSPRASANLSANLRPQQQRIRLLLCGFVVALTFACAPAEPPEPPAAPPAAPQHVVIEEMAVTPGQPIVMLPAYETAAERAHALKSDTANEIRNKNRQWYAATEPLPKDQFRSFNEWEKMKDVWTTYSMGSGKPVRRMFAEQTIAFLRHAKPRVKAHVIVSTQAAATDFSKAVDEFGIKADEKADIVFVIMPNQTIWHIDYGPFPVVDKKNNIVAFTDFIYYPDRHIDDAIPTRIGREFYKDVSTYRMPFPFEGGNIQADGAGNCATTNRALSNTGFSALKVRNLLKNYAGCDTTHIVKDITDDGTGHIDMFFKWIDVDHVMFGQYEDEMTLDYDGDGKDDVIPMPGAKNQLYKETFATNKKRMDDNVAYFAGLTAPNGKPYKVSRLTMMTWFKDDYGDLPRTFINSTFANGVNAYPSYATSTCQDADGKACMNDGDCCPDFSDCKLHCAAARCTSGPAAQGCDELLLCGKGLTCTKDPLKVALTAKAQKQWEEAMPTWTHVGLRADSIALWSGAIHCITRTIPDFPFAKTVADATCLNGKCDCSPGGTSQACADDTACFGPEWKCGCQICKGKCATGKACNDDADCAVGDQIVAGSCQIDPEQACYGLAASTGCGNIPYEGACNGTTFQYCDKGFLKSVSCPNCCAWNKAEGVAGCLAGAQCGCNDECPAVGATGCSVDGAHAWTCGQGNGCLVRTWKGCGQNEVCAAASGSCKSNGPPQVCPVVVAPDAGSTDTTPGADATGSDAVAQDDATSGADSGGVDGALLVDGVTGADTKTPGVVTPVAPSPGTSGCTAGPRGSASGWLAAFAALAVAITVSRRRREVR